MKTTILIAMPLLVLVACSELDREDGSNPEQMKLWSESLANDNNDVITNTEDVLNITSNFLSDENTNIHGRHRGEMNITTCGPEIERSIIIDRTHIDTVLYIGTLTIDYGTGKGCNTGHKGKIIDEFRYIVNAKKQTYSSRERITLDGFEKNSQVTKGTFLVESSTDNPVSISTQGVRILYPDGTTLIMSGALEFDYNAGNDDTASGSKVTGSLQGVSRSNSPFQTIITVPVEFSLTCSETSFAIPVKGTILTKSSHTESTSVDYGNGECDRNFSITINGNANLYTF